MRSPKARRSAFLFTIACGPSAYGDSLSTTSGLAANSHSEYEGTGSPLDKVVLPMRSESEKGEEGDGRGDHGNQDGEDDGVCLSHVSNHWYASRDERS